MQVGIHDKEKVKHTDPQKPVSLYIHTRGYLMQSSSSATNYAIINKAISIGGYEKKDNMQGW